MRRRASKVGAVVLGSVLALASCGVGKTNAADRVTDVGARLTGEVWSTTTGPASYWFEHGPTVDYGSTTTPGSVSVTSTEYGVPVTAPISGLAEATEHHYRLCVHDAAGHGVCGADGTFITSSGNDSVTGRGRLTDLFFFETGGDVDARSAADGSGAAGTVYATPGTSAPNIGDSGPVTCLRVEGNRAAIGFVALPLGIDPAETPRPRMAFVEDNGPTGDRWATVALAETATSCPVPTASDFPAGIGSLVAVGDFVVHDHVAL